MRVGRYNNKKNAHIDNIFFLDDQYFVGAEATHIYAQELGQFYQISQKFPIKRKGGTTLQLKFFALVVKYKNVSRCVFTFMILTGSMPI